MKIKLKKVYYCEYCKKHSLRSLEKHELHCTLNPNRECRMEHPDIMTASIPELVIKYKNRQKQINDDIDNEPIGADELMNDVGGCPICALTVVRLANITFTNFDYRKERQKYWDAENEEKYQHDLYY